MTKDLINRGSQLLVLPINKIEPDKHQPRQFISPQDVKELAESITQTGLINPVIVDTRNKIICGEIRWHACKKAGLKEIPCRVLDIPSENRAIYQLSENIHQFKMAPLEIAKVLKKIGSGTDNSEKIARLLGKSPTWVKQHLALLQMPEPLQKEIDKHNAPLRAATAITKLAKLEKEKKVSEGTTRQFAEKVMKKDIGSRDGMEKIIQAIEDNPGKAKDYLAESYGKDNQFSVQEKIDRIAPSKAKQIRDLQNTQESMEKMARYLTSRLKKMPFEKCGIDRIAILSELKKLKKEIENWHPSLK